MARTLVLLLVLRYEDVLETFATAFEAELFIRRHLPLLPDAVWDEGDDCEVVTKYDVQVTNGQVKLLALTHR